MFNYPFDFNKPMTVLDVEKMCERMEANIKRIRKKNRECAEQGKRPAVFFDFADMHDMAGTMCEWSNRTDKGAA